MARRRPQLGFEAISIEGGLLTPDFLARVAELQAARQAPEDYRLPRGLNIRDEIGRAWRIAEAHWRDVTLAGAQRTGRERALFALLAEAFGWSSLQRLTTPLMVGGRPFPVSGAAVGGRVPVVVAGADHDLDSADERFGDGEKRRSPFGLVQEYLNAEDKALWGLVTNGASLRLVRDNASLTRPAWIEVDLARIFGEQRYADFSLLWLLLHETRLGAADAPAHEAIIEQWRGKSLEAGTAARDRLREGVEAAVRALGNGFLAHPANVALRERLTTGAIDAAGYQQELLRLIYRMIFLLVAEERGLLHAAGSDEASVRTYRDGYALQRLRERSVRRRSYDRHDDAWDALLVTIRGCATGEPQLALPGLGGLFAATQCPDLDSSRLPNRALLEAVYRLTWLTDDSALVRVNWRDMGTEELGSVYESLLELVPELHEGAQRFGFVGDPAPGFEGQSAATQGNARKLTGSYYTPDSLVQALLESTLDPVIERALAADDPEKALLSLAILDPAMGSGHFLLGAARRIAAHLARLRSDGTPGPQAFRAALREVISHCVYGVDKNPMAVELARIALWLEAMEPGKPLAFLDHHLVHGDAILGIHDPAVLRSGIPDEAYAPLTGDDRPVATALKRANAAERRALEREVAAGQYTLTFNQIELARHLAVVDALPDGTLEEVSAKATALATAGAQEDVKLHFACDAYVAAFLMRKDAHSRDTVPTTGTFRNLTAGILPSDEMRAAVARVAYEVPFLHWPITFAPVMARGGFDCVVGNPPWEKVTLNDKEFFATRAPEIAQAATGALRERLIAGLAGEPVGTPARRIHDDYVAASHLSEATSAYAHSSGRFPLTGTGIVNLYALFAEVALRIGHPGGRAGLVLPSGIASDAGTAPFFRYVAEGRLASLIDFENREKLFEAVDSRMKFCLLTIGRVPEAKLAFFLTQPEQRFDDRRRFTLSADDLIRLNPNTGTAPIFRSKADAELTAKIYRSLPVLWDETRADGNPWGVQFRQGVFNMTSDSGLFETAPRPGLVPLYEAKMIHQYDHRWATYTGGDEDSARDVTEEEKLDPDYGVRPRYWVPKDEVEARLRAKGWARPWLLGWRRIARATDERTFICTLFPRTGAGDSIFLLMPANEIAESQIFSLVGFLNSLVHDYAVRQKVGGTNTSFHFVRQFPVPAPAQMSGLIAEEISKRVLSLLSVSSEMRGALPASHDGVASTVARAGILAEIDALSASLAGLHRRDLEFILDPSEVYGSEYPTETFRVLKNKEVALHGEYRTRRLVLDAWDRLVGAR